MKTYKLLKFIEPKTSIPVGGTFKAGDLIRLDNWNTIPADWLIEHGYIEEVKDRSTSWEELGEIEGYWVDSNCEIYSNGPYAISTKDEGKNVFKNKQQAEASIALAQITQLLAAYDIPEESNIRFHHDRYDYNRKGLLGFDTKEKRDHFYKHHKALIDKLAPFYIF